METAGKSNLPGGSHSLEVLASHHSQCSFTHSPIVSFGAVNDSCPYLSLSSDSNGVEGSSSSSSSFPAVIPLVLKKYFQSCRTLVQECWCHFLIDWRTAFTWWNCCRMFSASEREGERSSIDLDGSNSILHFHQCEKSCATRREALLGPEGTFTGMKLA